jgi:hypothetical protein
MAALQKDAVIVVAFSQRSSAIPSPDVHALEFIYVYSEFVRHEPHLLIREQNNARIATAASSTTRT